MIVFKLSWLPYMILFMGVYFLTDGQIGAALLFLAVGGGWLYFKFSGKGKAVTGTTTRKIEDKPAKPASQVQSEQAAATRQFCRHCGAKTEQYDVFCSSCGQKL